MVAAAAFAASVVVPMLTLIVEAYRMMNFDSISPTLQPISSGFRIMTSVLRESAAAANGRAAAGAACPAVAVEEEEDDDVEGGGVRDANVFKHTRSTSVPYPRT